MRLVVGGLAATRSNKLEVREVRITQLSEVGPGVQPGTNKRSINRQNRVAQKALTRRASSWSILQCMVSNWMFVRREDTNERTTVAWYGGDGEEDRVGIDD